MLSPMTATGDLILYSARPRRRQLSAWGRHAFIDALGASNRREARGDFAARSWLFLFTFTNTSRKPRRAKSCYKWYGAIVRAFGRAQWTKLSQHCARRLN